MYGGGIQASLCYEIVLVELLAAIKALCLRIEHRDEMSGVGRYYSVLREGWLETKPQLRGCLDSQSPQRVKVRERVASYHIQPPLHQFPNFPTSTTPLQV